MVTELISGTGVNVSGAERNGSERSWNKGQNERNEGGIDRMKRNQTGVACMHGGGLNFLIIVSFSMLKTLIHKTFILVNRLPKR